MLAAILTLALAPPATASPAPLATPTPNPDVLFARARAALAKRTYPRAIAYDVGVETSQNGKLRIRHFKTGFRATTGEIVGRVISDEENDDPTHPSGINIQVGGFNVTKPDDDPFGVPHLAPVYTFGLVPYAPILPATGLSATFAVPVDGTSITPSRAAQDAFPFELEPGPALPQTPQGGIASTPASTPAVLPSGIKPIGRVQAVNKIYEVSFLGEVLIDNAPCWHLRLRPLLNPGRYRVRDLYIDESNDQTMRIRTEGDFTLPNIDCYWDTNFTQMGGHWFISDETADQGVDGFDSIRITFSGYRSLLRTEENLLFGVAKSNAAEILEEP